MALTSYGLGSQAKGRRKRGKWKCGKLVGRLRVASGVAVERFGLIRLGLDE